MRANQVGSSQRIAVNITLLCAGMKGERGNPGHPGQPGKYIRLFTEEMGYQTIIPVLVHMQHLFNYIFKLAILLLL